MDEAIACGHNRSLISITKVPNVVSFELLESNMKREKEKEKETENSPQKVECMTWKESV
jgi:hypothetical protein